MKANHTPGPWQVNKKVKTSVETVKDGQGINLIAQTEDPDGQRSAIEDQANAKLIAAAPLMLEALIKIRQHGVREFSDDGSRHDDYEFITELLGSALTLATE
jgi:hypothetical protein